MAVALVDRYASVLGRPQAIALARESIQALAEKAGRQIADQRKSNSLEELARVVQEVWAREEALQITFHGVTHDRLGFDVHRCRYAELYETLVCGIWGAIFPTDAMPFLPGGLMQQFK